MTDLDSTFRVGDGVRVNGEVVWVHASTMGISLAGTTLVFVEAELPFLGIEVVKPALPPAPPPGSLVKLGARTWLHTHEGFRKVFPDGSLGLTVFDWQAIYQAGYKVATFDQD